MNEKNVRIGNRISGLAMVVFGGAIMSGGGAFIPAGAVFAIEGVGDLVSGDHHYVSSNVAGYLSKGKIKWEYQFDRYKK